MISLNAISLLSYALVKKQIVDDEVIWEYMYRQVKSRLDTRRGAKPGEEMENIRKTYDELSLEGEKLQGANQHLIAFQQTLREVLTLNNK
jgi:hypothetical protein